MIYVFDFDSHGRTHLPFNSLVIKIIATAYPDHPLVFWAQSQHIAALQEEMGLFPANVSFQALPEFPETKSICFLIRQPRIGPIAYLANLDLPENTIVLGATGTFLKQLFREKHLFSKSNFDIVFHATISALGYKQSLASRILKRDLFTIFKLKFPPQLRFVLLEQAIERNLRKFLLATTKTTTLEHPVEERPMASGGSLGHDRLRIAFLGGATKAKGFEAFAAGASKNNPKVEFHCIGSAPSSYDSDLDDRFATPPQRTPLPQAEFDQRVGLMDLICLPLDPIYYNWAASGTLADCIRFGIPPITIRNDVVTDLESRYGRFGYIFDAAEEIPEFLAKIDFTTVGSDLPPFKNTLARISRDRSVSTLSRVFRLNNGSPG